MYLEYYLDKLNYQDVPEFMKKYLKAPSLLRLKKVGYFCGMDYASKDIYNFKEYISRYDHSLAVALITYRFTKSKEACLAGLFHDAATPCFAHVIDYMNKDYSKQESTEEYTEKILREDEYLLKCLKEDNINIENIYNFKKYTIVDNNRPKLCADRIDGVILTGISWTKNISIDDIEKIVDDLTVFTNEYGEEELGFKSEDIAKKVVEVSESIDVYCHSKEDNFMMELLAQITKYAIDNKLFTYDDLYYLNEDEIWDIIDSRNDKELKEMVSKFKNVKKEETQYIDLPNVKPRDLNPLVNGKRVKGEM
ncbi:MAG: HD domain-containing protein [Clostridia bacterium]|nr:HD domain-containing protein [Bacilli bacterium]MBR3511581.1 HD domain-containing protein [Clostridia bacterium]